MMVDHNTIKQWKKESKLNVTDLIALSVHSDPFYLGEPFKLKRAQWFVDLWHQFGFTTGVHLRRIHYRLISQEPPILRHTGKPYENTDASWSYLKSAGRYARYLRLIPYEAFIDQKNPPATIYAYWQHPEWEEYEDPTPAFAAEYEIDTEEDYHLDDLPDLGWLPDALPDKPDFTIDGYDSIEQDYHVEVWIEKTTMNDVIQPICRKYRVNLVTGAGELSITSVVDLLRRVRSANRPARIFYVSDYDLKGNDMPNSISRKIEFFQREEGYDDLDIRLNPLILTKEQVAHYNLPRAPMKPKTKGKGRWDSTRGKGVVELDALEALHPGELGRIITEAVEQYYDTTLRDRANEQKDNLSAALDDAREEVIPWYKPDLEPIQADYDQLVEDFNETNDEFNEFIQEYVPKIEDYQKRLADILERVRETYREISRELNQVDVNPDDEDYRLPEVDLPPDPDNQLYDSRRSYLEQLPYYHERKFNLAADDDE